MRYTAEDYKRSAAQLRAYIGDRTPEILLILGSGLGFLGDVVEDAVRVPYTALENFPVSTAPGHAGQFVFGTLAGKSVSVMQGRATPTKVTAMRRYATRYGSSACWAFKRCW